MLFVAAPASNWFLKFHQRSSVQEISCYKLTDKETDRRTISEILELTVVGTSSRSQTKMTKKKIPRFFMNAGHLFSVMQCARVIIQWTCCYNRSVFKLGSWKMIPFFRTRHYQGSKLNTYLRHLDTFSLLPQVGTYFFLERNSCTYSVNRYILKCTNRISTSQTCSDNTGIITTQVHTFLSIINYHNIQRNAKKS